MDNELYYQEVQSVVDEILVEVSKQKLQLKDPPRKDRFGKWDKTSGALFITSVKNRALKEHKEGVVTLASYWQAAAGIVGSTGQGQMHRVSTDDEIRDYLAEQQRKREEILGAAARLKGVAQFNVVPPVNEGVK